MLRLARTVDDGPTVGPLDPTNPAQALPQSCTKPLNTPSLRAANLDDLDALVALEQACFSSDRFNRRSFRYLLSKARAATLVAPGEKGLLGYAMLLFHRGTSLGRLYSLAVAPAARGQGLAKRLLEAAEQRAIEQGCAYLRLEVRSDNQPAQALYRSAGYKPLQVLHDYYEDHQDGLRFEKLLLPKLRPAMGQVPYYRQTLDFTCGPAALMMAMSALDPGMLATRTLEMRLWREATTIFMTSGHGGCSPYGLALSAAQRGFAVTLWINSSEVPLADSVRREDKKEVMRLVQDDMREQLIELQVPIHQGCLNTSQLRELFSAGTQILVLISTYRIDREKSPHWVIVTGFDDRFVYLHDPFVDRDKDKSEIDCVNLPIAHADFDRMCQYGRAGLRSVILLELM